MTVEDCTIRKNWHEIELGELATFRTGPFGSTFHKADYVIGGTPLINPSHIVDGDIVPDETITVRPELAKRLSVFALREGEIVIGRRGDMGRCAVVKRRHDGFLCGTGSMIVRPRPGINAHLLQALLSSPEVVARIEENSVGTTMINLNQGTLASLKIRISTEAKEQEAIAEALSDADALIEGLERLIAKKRLIKQGAMQDLLTAKRRLPWFSGEWREVSLGMFGNTYGGLSGKSKKDFGHGGGRYVEFLDVLTNEVIPRKEFPKVFIAASERQNAVRQGDLLFNGSSETPEEVGLCAELSFESEQLFLNSFCFGFRPSPEARLVSRFLALLIRSAVGRDRIKHLAQGATRYNLSKKRLLELKLPMPNFDEQLAISALSADMDAEIQALETRLEKARQIKAGMMQNLLTGRIRLV